MPGRGPAPKPREQRRDRHKKQAGDWVQLPPGGYQGPIPSLAGVGLSDSTYEWWKTIWRSPMATQWTEGDVPALKELAMLRELLLDGKMSVAAEVRLRSDSFGLTPAGRQQRRWMITEEDQERAGAMKSKEPSLRRLRAVDPLLNK
jgi:hypothetical protein